MYHHFQDVSSQATVINIIEFVKTQLSKIRLKAKDNKIFLHCLCTDKAPEVVKIWNDKYCDIEYSMIIRVMISKEVLKSSSSLVIIRPIDEINELKRLETS